MEDIIDLATEQPNTRGEGIAERKRFVNEDTAVFCALVLLKKGLSPDYIAARPEVNLPVRTVMRLAHALKIAGITCERKS